MARTDYFSKLSSSYTVLWQSRERQKSEKNKTHSVGLTEQLFTKGDNPTLVNLCREQRKKGKLHIIMAKSQDIRREIVGRDSREWKNSNKGIKKTQKDKTLSWEIIGKWLKIDRLWESHR